MSTPIAIVIHKRSKQRVEVLERTKGGGWYVRFPNQAGIQWKSDAVFARNFRLLKLVAPCEHQFDLSEGRACVKCGFNPKPVQS